MRFWLILSVFSVLYGSGFDTWYTGQTFRFDYFHTGTAGEEHFSPDQIRLEGEWPGSRTNLVDELNFGKYYFEILDEASGRTIFSQGFCSIYGEWETISDALDGNWGTFHESIRFPEPKAKVRLVIQKRQADQSFREIYSILIDPYHYSVNRSHISRAGRVWEMEVNAPVDKAVDILVLGDGYTKKERKKFHADTKRLLGVLLDTEPFKSNRDHFNVRAIDLYSPGSGISSPRGRFWNASALDLRYNSFDSDRYVLAYENKRIREIAAQAPYDALVILVNSAKYGGGGILNLYATVAVDTEPADYIMVHEFGHSFGALADEYYSSNVAYEEFNLPGVEPWDPNITALLEPGYVKWGHLVDEDTPLPTPWDQAAYDSAGARYRTQRQELISAGGMDAEAMNELMRTAAETTTGILESNQYYGKVGAFEGAGYQSQGLYRPSVDCIMFSRNAGYFCPVCQATIEKVIKQYTE